MRQCLRISHNVQGREARSTPNTVCVSHCYEAFRQLKRKMGDKHLHSHAKRVVYDGFRLPHGVHEEDFRSAIAYQPKGGDLFVASFPKSGTTWMQYIVCLIYNNGTPPEGPIMFGATPFLEMIGGDGVDEYERPTPIKTHFPYNLTPISSDAKYIYVVRNPKDTCVSYYHHCIKSEAHCEEYRNMSFDTFFEMFYDGTTDWNDYFDHVVSWYAHKDDPNVLFVTYEDMKEDLEGVIKRVATFMGGNWAARIESDAHLLGKIVFESSLPAMKENVNKSMSILGDKAGRERIFPPKVRKIMDELDAVGATEGCSDWQFVRKGIVGDWVNHLSDDQNARLTAKARTRLAACTELLVRWRL